MKEHNKQRITGLLTAVLLALVVMMPATPVYGDTTTANASLYSEQNIDVEQGQQQGQQQGQEQGQQQDQKAIATANNEGVRVSMRNIPMAPLPSSSAAIGMASYGSRVTSYSLIDFVNATGWYMDGFGYEATVETMDEEDVKDWKEVKKEIQSNSVETGKRFPALEKHEKVYFMTSTMVDLSSVAFERFTTTTTLNTKLNHKRPVLTSHFLTYLYWYASKRGANRVYILGENEQLTARASSGFSLGLGTGITSCTTGGALSIGFGGAKKVSAYGNVGIRVVLYRDADPVITVTEPCGTKWSMAEIKRQLDACQTFCENNTVWRNRAGIEQSCQKNYAEAWRHYNIALMNIEKGVEPDGRRTITLPNARAMTEAVYYNMSYVIRMTNGSDGRAKQHAFLAERGISVAPTELSDLKDLK